MYVCMYTDASVVILFTCVKRMMRDISISLSLRVTFEQVEDHKAVVIAEVEEMMKNADQFMFDMGNKGITCVVSRRNVERP